jgi:hypothetical protein
VTFVKTDAAIWNKYKAKYSPTGYVVPAHHVMEDSTVRIAAQHLIGLIEVSITSLAQNNADAVLARPSASVSETTTFAPSLKNRSAQDLPIPRAAPVTTATLDTFMLLAPV